ncbi:MAG: phosphatidate cytidylyltransferase, partial [Candidatus Omnitrophica bacterium]|nr:phosphatidate cytidylyltransferase [Candidatus Omnitrophota bacterium]
MSIKREKEDMADDNIARRIATALLIVLFSGITVFVLPNWFFCLVTTLFIGLALYEFFSIVENKGLFVYKYFGITAGTLIPVGICLHLGEGYANLEPVFIVLACLCTFVLQFARRDGAKDHLVSAAITLFALFYISWFFSFFIKIKYLPDGAKLVAFLILVTKMNDVGAYFIGRKFGKNLLIKRISPRKTREGALGGLVFGVLSAVVCKFFLIDLSVGHLIFLGILLGITGQMGDLAESLFKRDFDVKDASGILPGLGGMLDVID